MDLRDFITLSMLGVAVFEYIVILLKDDEIKKLKIKLTSLKKLEGTIQDIQRMVTPPKRKK